MAKKKVYSFIFAFASFIAYILLAAQPVPRETILSNNWLSSLESVDGNPASAREPIVPFSMGNRYGYVDSRGNLLINKEKEQYVSLSAAYWSEYPPIPRTLVINDPLRDTTIVLESPQGYPFFLGNRIFIIGKDQCSLDELDRQGNVLWQYSFESPITCLDASESFVLAGTLAGTIEVLDSDGASLFPPFAPGASRIPVIAGCRISADGSMLAVVSGIDKQRFLFLELYGNNDYRVTFHIFLEGSGFRREVQMSFIENDTMVIFEQESGLGVYDVRARNSITLPLSGTLETIDPCGGDGIFFYITDGQGVYKNLTAIKPPNLELINIPYKSGNVFLFRKEKELIIGGGNTLASFTLEKR